MTLRRRPIDYVGKSAFAGRTGFSDADWAAVAGYAGFNDCSGAVDFAAASIGSVRVVAAFAGTRPPEDRTLASPATRWRFDLLAPNEQVEVR